MNPIYYPRYTLNAERHATRLKCRSTVKKNKNKTHQHAFLLGVIILCWLCYTVTK